jgi:hypothetical protein
MKRTRSLVSLFIMLLLLPAIVRAQQPWSGILSPSRAIDWTQAGIPGGLPSSGWTQCGSTIAPYSGGAAKITNALASCGGQNKFVLLGAGTFNISSGQITFPTTGHVALRGMGANSTFMVFSGTAGVGVACSQFQSVICAVSKDGSSSTAGPTTYNWTAGYAQGSNQITLSSVANITPNSTLLFLDQCEDGYTGSPCRGSDVDTGQIYACQDLYHAGSSATGCSSNGGDGATRNNRGQEQIVVATAIDRHVVTISSPLAAPNWRASQNPQVWIVQSISQVGVENMSIDGTSSNTPVGVEFASAYQWWVSGVKFVRVPKYGINAFQVAYGIIAHNYFFHPPGNDPYGTRLSDSSFVVIQNNIYHQVINPIVFDGADTGSVVAYNFDINNINSTDFMKAAFYNHNVNQFQLYEGNIANEQTDDGNHGTTAMITRFRNFFTGWESCGNGQCGSQALKDAAAPVSAAAFSRYGNFVGNVLGTPGIHVHYWDSPPYGTDYNIYVFGPPGNGIPADPRVASTSFRWANYDVVTGAVRFCGNSSDTGWSSTCAGTSEVSSGISPYPNLLPTIGDTGAGQSAMPASLYLSSKPSWFGSIPWPPIGPDVSGGNVGQCSGSPVANSGTMAGVAATSSSQCVGTSLTSPAWGGHLNANPAMNCALNVMGMPPDGSGGALSFNASACYGDPLFSQGPNPPTNLVVVVN